VPPRRPPSRQQAKHATRRALLRAAREAFHEQGTERPSLDSIAERAGLTRGAFYVHFRSREDLVEAVVKEDLEAVIEALLRGSETARGLEAVIDRFVALANAAPPRGLLERATGGLPFHEFVRGAHRSPRIARVTRGSLESARARLARSVEASGAPVPPDAAATLLLLVALGGIVATEIPLPLGFAASARLLLDWLDLPERRSGGRRRRAHAEFL
jgi:AcrR family transcriptional regulator